ncbi:hypothetical protein Pmar_PMAR004050 [Perkinsus marinus ATCC 50983]|uniref:Uncharacterized protein n=1 Tax=Perkinsus marinus (strain ATCC 50983 / TXsc) TaxID=423536 RepID=C5LZI5_PERM5|nr:hypothetical protein Pmar_PMAR004050 [Perkinsus marinus ATCC 50983]EEQ97852.1 hypothetical protein Pmar_PMAR004050 [Perkinsus marinus ATCC 50983]|eukprot:XP_002765135.1 hypothetical protein Pmar_PMAR004050 [Perkinsus marinus ATCC 50983]
MLLGRKPPLTNEEGEEDILNRGPNKTEAVTSRKGAVNEVKELTPLKSRQNSEKLEENLFEDIGVHYEQPITLESVDRERQRLIDEFFKPIMNRRSERDKKI